MKKAVILNVVLCLVGIRAVVAQAPAEGLEIRPAQVSVVPGVGTNGTSARYYQPFSFNLLGGRNGGVVGFELGGILNIDKQFATGLQIGGIANLVGGPVNGLQIGGILNTAGETTNGMQLGGIANVTAGSARGLQLAGVVNTAPAGINGAQIGGVVNIA